MYIYLFVIHNLDNAWTYTVNMNFGMLYLCTFLDPRSEFLGDSTSHFLFKVESSMHQYYTSSTVDIRCCFGSPQACTRTIREQPLSLTSSKYICALLHVVWVLCIRWPAVTSCLHQAPFRLEVFEFLPSSLTLCTMLCVIPWYCFSSFNSMWTANSGYLPNAQFH